MSGRRIRRSERGAILVMSAAGLVLAMVSAALAIDIGFLAADKRTDQKIADLAALDASRDLAGVTANCSAPPVASGPLCPAVVSATRNFASTDAVASVSGERVKSDGSGGYVADAAGMFVRVTVSSPRKPFFPFVPSGSKTVTAKAVAGGQPEAAFSVGSSLANLDTQKSLLDPVLGNMLGDPTALNMSAVSYSGLATGNVSLSALQTNLLAMGYDVGTTDKLLANNVRVADLLRASALALAAQGNAAAAAEVNDIPLASISNLEVVNLGRLVSLSQPGSDSALDTTLNVFQLLTGSAAVANGDNFVAVPGVTVNVPGVATVGFKLKVIEPAQTARGPVGTKATTSQVTLQLNLSILPLVLLGPTIALDLNFNAARAEGELTDIDCDAFPSITVAMSTAGSTVTGSGVVPLLGTLTATGTLAAGAGGPPLQFDYPADFVPPVGTDADGQRVSVATLDLSPATVVVTGSGLAGVTAGLVQAVLPTILTAVDALATPLLQPVLRALGADVAAADVTALGIYDPPPACGTPGLVQ